MVRPEGSIPSAIRPAGIDFARDSSRRVRFHWVLDAIRPVWFDFACRPAGSISLGFGRDSSRRFDFAVESTRRVRSRCPQFANRPVGFDFARVRLAKLFKAFTTIIKPTFSGGVRGRVIRCPCLKACFF